MGFISEDTNWLLLGESELSPEILWISDHIERLKTEPAAMNYSTTNLHAVVAKVIVTEVVTYLMAHNPGISYGMR
jgi:hypothetical protein